MKRRHLLALLLLQLTLLLTAARAEPEELVAFNKKFSVPADSTYVDFGDLVISDYNALIRFLRRLPKLEKCDMYATGITRDHVEQLAELFPEVEFGWTMRIGSAGCYHIVRTDAEVFSTFHHSGVDGHPAGTLRVLRFCKHLKALDIGHNQVEDLSWISELTELRVLILAINDFTDISPLASLTHLQYLEMFRTHVHDISPLAGLTELLDLNISYNNIHDLSPLYGLPKLERLWVYNSMPVGSVAPISHQAYEELCQALPNTYIDNENPPTAGGWREHPRYWVVANMFFEGGTSYTPFDEAEDTAEPELPPGIVRLESD